MAVRTTSDKVRGIIPEMQDEDVSLTPFIEAASGIVDALLDTSTGYAGNPVLLERIERWLGAHFYKILDPELVRDEVSTLRQVYLVKNGLGLDQTRYGQMAKLIDHKGILAAWDNTLKTRKTLTASTRYVGGKDDDE